MPGPVNAPAYVIAGFRLLEIHISEAVLVRSI